MSAEFVANSGSLVIDRPRLHPAEPFLSAFSIECAETPFSLRSGTSKTRLMLFPRGPLGQVRRPAVVARPLEHVFLLDNRDCDGYLQPPCAKGI